MNDNLSTLRIDLQSMKSFCQCTHAASQIRSNFSHLRSRKMFYIGAARFKIQICCGKFKISKFQSSKRSKILNSAGLYKFIKFEIAKFLQPIFKF
nr:hypothetical protein [uncultured Campylobacter sp.]